MIASIIAKTREDDDWNATVLIRKKKWLPLPSLPPPSKKKKLLQIKDF